MIRTGADHRRQNDPLWTLRTSLGAAVALLDCTVARMGIGLEAQNYFNLFGSFGSAHSATHTYGRGFERPVYHALRLYGQYVRGEMITASVEGSGSFDPWGPGASTSEEFLGRGGPVDVPYVAVYAFRSGDRDAYLLINRHLRDAIDVRLHLEGSARSPQIAIHALTGPTPTAHNEDGPTVDLTHEIRTDFDPQRPLSLAPHSAYVIVSYAEGAAVCLDEDGDGFGANPYETEGCPGGAEIVDIDDRDPTRH